MWNIALFGWCFHEEDKQMIRPLLDRLRTEVQSGSITLFVYAPLLASLTKEFGEMAVENIQCFDDRLPRKIDLLLSLGGDGTLLDTLPLVRDSGVRVMGVNLGSLGFLSGADRGEVDTLLEELKQGHFREEKRSVLQVEILREGTELGFPYALNEVVVFKRDTDSLISIRVKVNGCLLNKYCGDGVIFATATGSTAYSLSCGGPILSPQTDALLVTPVASHTLTVRPLLLPADSELEVEVEGTVNFKIALDSDIYTQKGPFLLKIKKAPFCFHTLRLERHNFFATLRQKLMWGADGRHH